MILTCAISGALASRDQCPAIPYTPAEYAAEARRIADEGGVMVHIHARTPDGTPSYAIEDFRAITDAIRDEVGRDLIINYSTGALGVPMDVNAAIGVAAFPADGHNVADLLAHADRRMYVAKGTRHRSLR